MLDESPETFLREYTYHDDLTGRSVTININDKRSNLLTRFAKETLADRYLLNGETPQDMFARVACSNSDEIVWGKRNGHAQRIYDAISKLWFMPATPVLSNSGTSRGLPISCFLNEVGDSLESISDAFNENFWLAARGGGIGTYWGDVRSIDETVGRAGKTSGVVSFVKIQDSMTLGISQGSLRRGSAAVYLTDRHPEIEEFLDIRRPGDVNRRSLNVHHGVALSDAFMRAVENGDSWDLYSPHTGAVIKTISARGLWQKLLKARLETGEPYILWIDTVNAMRPEIQKELGLRIKTSNLCVEITLPTGEDHLKNWRTAVCCLSSLNFNYAQEWYGNQGFIDDFFRFLDNVLERFIRLTDGMRGFERARYAAMRERSVGAGMMGFHSSLQQRGISYESDEARTENVTIWEWLRETADEVNLSLSRERGACPDAIDAGVDMRFTNMFAIAPTASISIIASDPSPCGEPWNANIFTQKTLAGTHTVKNPALDRLLRQKWMNDKIAKNEVWSDGMRDQWLDDIWSNILGNGGSVQHLGFLTDEERDVFKTAFEIDQNWVVQHAADRTPYIHQSQSTNIFLRPNVSIKELHDLHMNAWKAGVKSLYYLRSQSLQRAEYVSNIAGEMPTSTGAPEPVVVGVVEESGATCGLKPDECSVCQ